MLVVTKEDDFSKVKAVLPSSVEVISWGQLLNNWGQYRLIFRQFLDSEYEQLLVVLEPNRINLQEVSNLRATKFFDCFDVTSSNKYLPVKYQRIQYLMRLWMPTNMLNSLNALLQHQFLTRLIASNARASAISHIAREISTKSNIRPNWLSRNPAGIVFSRKAASTLFEFNRSDLLSPERVMISVLRSSNLAFGAFL